MKKNIVVLGAGLVGSAIAKDLAQKHAVTSVDRSAEALHALQKHGIKGVQADLSDQQAILDNIAHADLVIGAVPGFMGYATLKTVIEARKNAVDISFFPEDRFGLDELAKQQGVVAVMDCGFAPGLGNILLGHEEGGMKIECY